MIRRSILMAGFCLFLIVIQAAAAEKSTGRSIDHRSIDQMIALPDAELSGACNRQVILRDALGGELFAVEKCPFCLPGRPEISVTKSDGRVSKGRIVYPFEARMRVTDFYAGREKKQFSQNSSGRVTADYIEAFGELSIVNIVVDGDPACAQPLVEHLKALTAGGE
jgi:hypothetical protein